MSADGDPIEVVAYDQNRVELFAVAERELRVALAPFVLEIEHIGSTAVPGLAAKPVIDIQVGVRTLDDSAEIVSAVESLGYEYVPEFEDELPDRRYFRRWNGHVRIRDWLRSHDDDRDRYAELKLNLAATPRDDRRAYTDAKSGFVRAIEEKSISAYAGPSPHGDSDGGTDGWRLRGENWR